MLLKKMYKLMFLTMVITGTLISISSYSWMGMWMGLEINLLSMMPLMSDNKSPHSTESSLKYFIIQALASMILLFSIIAASTSSIFSMNNEIMLIMNSALMTKMGMAPFHFWFPEIIDGLNWLNCFIMLTWQKIAPMLLMITNMASMSFINMIILISMTIGGIMGLNQTSLRKILVYSSINHMGWMMMALSTNETIWWIYMMTYTLISMILIYQFNSNKIFTISQLIPSMKLNTTNKISSMINFFSLGGLPPFIGFLPKWLVINKMIENNFIATTIIAVMLTLITLYFYSRIMFPTFTMNETTSNISKPKNEVWLINMFNSINLLGLPLCTIMTSLL
uniref:NADH-ubiquinone oxidoreductase chain 2 n=1 Tax=Gibbium aequinoctiale TaxID=1050274 RepID=A0A8J9WD94_9COLE|nr:NADH dehydrogenase subunit 2 [Gibbium aequinoctiale]ATN40777.1 NADH dehydrogenase subunit 2 [Gibbium aequinoctiale]